MNTSPTNSGSTIAAQASSESLPGAAVDLYRMNVAEYERLASASVFDDPRVELIDGCLERKLPIYARAGISICWIVNLISNQVEVYTEPSGSSDPVGYYRCEVVSPPDPLVLKVRGTVVGRMETAGLLA
jgi:Putative restriction endonuclease